MDQFTAFVGTYSDASRENVHSCDFSTDEGIRLNHSISTGGNNPSFVAPHPHEDILYAVNETDPGSVTAMRFDRQSGVLDHMGSVLSGSSGPCHCSVDADGRYVFVAHYTGAAVSSLPIQSDGRLSEPVSVIQHSGSSVNQARQSQAHPHSIMPGPNNRFVYVADLGTDEIIVYELNPDDGNLKLTHRISAHEGAGPRHIDFHPNKEHVYVLNELDSTLAVYRWTEESGNLTPLQTYKTLPPNTTVESFTSDVHVHPSGDFVYAANRGHNSIVAYEVKEDGLLRMIGHESTQGDYPRTFAIDPAGEYILTVNRRSDSIVIFEIDASTGLLTPTEHKVDVPSPACIISQ